MARAINRPNCRNGGGNAPTDIWIASTAFGQDTTPIIFGWSLAGSNPAHYFVSVVRPPTEGGRSIASLASRSGQGYGGGTLMQQIKADEYRRRPVRFTARIKTREVDVVWKPSLNAIAMLGGMISI